MLKTSSAAPKDFSTLPPDHVLNALESVGFRSDGRLLALNSYENRVYQIGIEEGAPLVAKFALKFGPPEFFAIQFLTFCSFVGVGREPPANTIVSMMAGFAASSCVDPNIVIP